MASFTKMIFIVTHQVIQLINFALLSWQQHPERKRLLYFSNEIIKFYCHTRFENLLLNYDT